MELRLRKASQCHCTGNADSLIRIAMACRWGFHKYSGIAHFLERASKREPIRFGIGGSRLTSEGPQTPS
jgi:hypothetical protein